VLAGATPIVTAAAAFIRDHAHEPISVNDVLRAVSHIAPVLERLFRTY